MTQDPLRLLVAMDALTDFDCARLRLDFTRDVPMPRSFQGEVNRELRDCDYIYVNGSWDETLSNLVADIVCPAYGLPLTLRDQPAVVYRYPVGVGFCAHHDVVTQIELDRARSNGQPVLHGTLTLIVSLSDPNEYVGGELVFPEMGVWIKPRKGTLLGFPATEGNVHEVRPVQRGERYSLVFRV